MIYVLMQGVHDAAGVMMANSNGHYTPTQHRLLAMLSDGEPHGIKELFECLADAEGAKQNYIYGRRCLTVHLVALRRHLRPRGMDIICQKIYRRSNYRIVRPITSVE